MALQAQARALLVRLSRIRSSLKLFLCFFKRVLAFSNSTILEVFGRLFSKFIRPLFLWGSRATERGKGRKSTTGASPGHPEDDILQIYSPECSSSIPDDPFSRMSLSLGTHRDSTATVSLEGAVLSLKQDEMPPTELGDLQPFPIDVPPIVPGEPLNEKTDTTPYLNNANLRPVMPDNTGRYRERKKIPKGHPPKKIKPMHLFYDSRSAPAGWVYLSYPEGGRYFYNAEKRTYTDADVCQPVTLETVLASVEILETFIRQHEILFPTVYDLVIDLTYPEGKAEPEVKYYYVHHATRSIFFLDEFDAHKLDVWFEIEGEISDHHLKHEIEAQYWYHVVLYPHCLKVSKELAQEILNMALHFIGDNMTSNTSTSPYHSEDLQQIISMTTVIQSNINELDSIGASSFAARAMHIFARSKFYHHHGEAHARVERSQTVHPEVDQMTWIIRIVSPFFFFLPERILKTLHAAYTDQLVHKYEWIPILRDLNHEWEQVMLAETILLNANFALLVVQGAGPIEGTRSPSQILVYVSIIFNLGSLCLGSLLTKVHKGEQTYDFSHFLTSVYHPIHGLTKVAILYSLPYALAVWGMIAFVLAFLLLCFQNSSVEVRVVVSAFAGTVILVSWSTWLSWEHLDGPPPTATRPRLFTALDISKTWKTFLTQKRRPKQGSQVSSSSTVV